MLRFDANLTFLFQEVDFYARFQQARRAGFTYVEFLNVFQFNLDELERAITDAGLSVVQFNFLDGDMPAGQRGFASHPDRQAEWRRAFQCALDMAARLHPIQMHSLAGVILPDLSSADQMAILVENLRWAAPQLERAGLPLMLEPLNADDNPRYLIQRTEEAIDVLRRVASPWIRLQFDFYHVQRSQGDLIRRLHAASPYIGHTQIADNPGRHEPGTGEINYRNVLSALERLGYERFIGLEYLPTQGTTASLAWLPRPARAAGCTCGDLLL